MRFICLKYLPLAYIFKSSILSDNLVYLIKNYNFFDNGEHKEIVNLTLKIWNCPLSEQSCSKINLRKSIKMLIKCIKNNICNSVSLVFYNKSHIRLQKSTGCQKLFLTYSTKVTTFIFALHLDNSLWTFCKSSLTKHSMLLEFVQTKCGTEQEIV